MQDVRNIDGYGPWSLAISHEERARQLRSMSAVAYMLRGPHDALWRTLRAAEVDPCRVRAGAGASRGDAAALAAPVARHAHGDHMAPSPGGRRAVIRAFGDISRTPRRQRLVRHLIECGERP